MSEKSTEGRGASAPVVIKMNQSSWFVIEETLEMDSESSMFDQEIREEIRAALDDTEVEYKGRAVFVTTTEGSWDTITETLSADSESSAFDRSLRNQIGRALFDAERIKTDEVVAV